MKVRKNPNAEFVKDICKKLEENSGYCPCRILKTPDTKCMCKEFREKIDRREPGYCRCGLFEIIDAEEDS